MDERSLFYYFMVGTSSVNLTWMKKPRFFITNNLTYSSVTNTWIFYIFAYIYILCQTNYIKLQIHHLPVRNTLASGYFQQSDTFSKFNQHMRKHCNNNTYSNQFQIIFISLKMFLWFQMKNYSLWNVQSISHNQFFLRSFFSKWLFFWKPTWNFCL